MINRYEELLNAFETKLRKLISEYRLLQAENQLVYRRQSQLETELEQAQATIKDLKKQNDHLVLLNQLGGSGENRKAAKQQIDKMVREIYQCLALLNE
jgi:FtsZ-binding cell division protein ZapB